MADKSHDSVAEDTTATELIQATYARMGLGSDADRAKFLMGQMPQRLASFDVVISTSSQPF